VRIAVDGGGEFAAWSSGAAGATVAAVAAPAAPAVAPGRVVDAPAAAAAPAPPADDMPVRRVAAKPAARRPQPKITVTYQDADIRDVLAAFASFSGRTIVVGRDINGSVTAEIKDQPWDIALQAILSSQGLAATEDGNGIIASTATSTSRRARRASRSSRSSSR
jgi:type IV pilus assembly protein PilQ